MDYLAHPARRSLTRVLVLMCKLSSVTWSHSHLVRAPFTLLASSAAKEGRKKKIHIQKPFLPINTVKRMLSQTGASLTHQE